MDINKLEENLSNNSQKGSVLDFPKNLFGRGKEEAIISNVYERFVKGEKCVIQIEGAAGIGKTTLIKATIPDSDKVKCYFGGHNQFDQGIPYQGLRKIFKTYISELSDNSEEVIRSKKERIKTLFENHLFEVGEIIPEIISFIEIDNNESIGPSKENSLLKDRHRVDILLVSLIEFIVTNRSLPVVMILEDIHWMDSSSFRVINVLLKKNIQGLMFVFTSRPFVKDDSSEMFEFRKLNSSLMVNCIIPLQGFSVEILENLLTQVLGKCDFEILNLANVLKDRSEGNPYLLREVLLNLERTEQLTYNPVAKQWNWKYKVQNIFKENRPIKELLDEKLSHMSDEEINYLQIGSCFGSTMNVPFISLITRIELSTLKTVYRWACELGFLERVNPGKDSSVYIFAHNLIAETIHNSFDKKERKNIHKRIGKYYLSNSPLGLDSRDLYTILYHLNESTSNECSPESKISHSKLNLQGAIKAKRSASFSVAYKYIKEAEKFNDHTLWEDQAEFATDFHIEAFQIASLVGERDEAKAFYKVCETHCKGIKLSELRLAKLIVDIQYGEMESALKTGITALRELGLNVPYKAGKVKVAIEFLKTKIKLRGLTPDDILSLPKLENDKVNLIFEILLYTYKAAYVISPELNGVLALKQMQLTLSSGINGEAYTGFVAYGVIIGAGTNNYKSAFEIADIAGKMADKFDYESGILDFGKSIYMCLKLPIRETLSYASSAKSKSYIAGDFLSAAEPSANESLIYLSAGFPLNEVAEVVENNKVFCEELSMRNYFDFQKIMEQHVKFLRGQNVSEALSNDVRRILASTEFLFSVSINKILEMQRCVFSKKWDEAVEIANTDKSLIQLCAGMHIHTEYYFFKAIALIKSAKSYGSVGNLRNRIFVNSVISKMNKWSQSAPENHNHKRLMLEGLVAQAKGDCEKSQKMFLKASEEAETLGYVQNAMLIYEFMSESKEEVSADQQSRYIAKSNSLRNKWLGVN